jgi:integrase/recombinase XerD
MCPLNTQLPQFYIPQSTTFTDANVVISIYYNMHSLSMHPEDFLSLKEWHELLNAASTPRETTLLWLMGGTGMRISEICSLKVEHIDREGGYVHITHGKGDKARTCIIPKHAVDAIDNYLQGRVSGYVFEGRQSGHLSSMQATRLLNEVAERATLQATRPGIERQRRRVTPHLLRHSFARWSLDAGIDISYLQQQLGHSNLSTTAI